MIDEYLEWAARDRNRSEHTLNRYAAVYVTLERFGDPETLTLAQAEAWWKSLQDQAPSSRANALAAVRSLYKWATRFDYRTDDPTRRIDPPRAPVRVPRMIGRADLARILGPLTDDAPDLRRAFALGAYGGLRVSEAATLDWADVDREQRRLYVTGKGNKQRPVPLSPLLLDYLLPDTGGNVVTAGGKPYTGATLQRRANRLLARAGIDHTFHDARKRGASLALSRGASMAAVRQTFGWSSMETVAHYAVVGDSELDRVAAYMAAES